jgi:hypothetical protein
LEKVLRLKPAAGPAVALFKLNAEEITRPVRRAILHPRLALIACKLKADNGSRLDCLLDLQTRARRGNVFEYRPFAVIRSGRGLPLDFDKISAELPLLVSTWSHDYSIDRSTQLFTPHSMERSGSAAPMLSAAEGGNFRYPFRALRALL